MLRQNSFIGNFLVFSSFIQMNIFLNNFFSNSLLLTIVITAFSVIKLILNFDIETDTFIWHTLVCTAFACSTNSPLQLSTAWNMPKYRLSLVRIYLYMDRIVSVFSRTWTKFPILSRYGKLSIKESPNFNRSRAMINVV